MGDCAVYTCGCTCGAAHEPAPDGPPVEFTKPWSGGKGHGSPLATCHTGLVFVKWLGGAHWVPRADVAEPGPQR